MLRYITPIRAMRRTATRDVDWEGQTIKAGDKVVCWFQAANRDPAMFSDPDQVKIDREDNEHVGFGWESMPAWAPTWPAPRPPPS
ncbi:cytochrome P450 [Citricoccus zhacaiensis]